MSEVCNSPANLALFWASPQSLSFHCDWVLRSAVTATVGFTFFKYVQVYLLTNLLESPFYFFLLRHQNSAQKFLGLFGGNTLTHPLVYFGLPLLFSQMHSTYGVYLTVAEIFAMIAEILFIRLVFKTPTAATVIVLSLANLFSWWFGAYLS